MGNCTTIEFVDDSGNIVGAFSIQRSIHHTDITHLDKLDILDETNDDIYGCKRLIRITAE